MSSSVQDEKTRNLVGGHGKEMSQVAAGSEIDQDATTESDSSVQFEHHKHLAHTVDLPTDWWFASTAIPLIAATLAPMANMLSIAALVVYWRCHIKYPLTDPSLRYSTSEPYKDPYWCINLNATSLACGFVGNLFLLFNFTKRVRYIVALPLTIIFFYFASGILIGIIVCIDKYKPPGPDDVYSQGFWHAIIAAVLYLINSMLLMVNMLGYYLGHYPQHFTLTDEQRNLILQTMLFFLWLAGGAAVFNHIEPGWGYENALYFCDVTILTIGFGDYYAMDDLGRGLVFPFSVGGTIILGLMVSSIHKFARELSKENVVRKHVEKRRVNTLSRAVTQEQLDDKPANSPVEHRSRLMSPLQANQDVAPLTPKADNQDTPVKARTINFQDAIKENYSFSDPSSTRDEPLPSQFFSRSQRSEHGSVHKSLRRLTIPLTKPVTATANTLRRVTTRNQKQILMLEERDRFNAMRSIQISASAFKRYYALSLSIISFGMLWCLGAMVFYFAEAETQGLNYFRGLYLCYVSLLTIGYGDLSPRSNCGKSFFIFWSLIAVPAMTILVSDLGDTVISRFKRGILQNDLGLTSEGSAGQSEKSNKRSIMRFFRKKPESTDKQLESKDNLNTELGLVDSEDRSPDPTPKTIEELANEDMSEAAMLRRLAFAIRRVAEDIKSHPGKKYKYEEWVEFTRLIRFSKLEADKNGNAIAQLEYDEVTEGVVEWDWLDEHSPMTSQQSESEWVLDRLCESLLRIFKKGDLIQGILSNGGQSNVDKGQFNGLSMPPLSDTFGPPALPNTTEVDAQKAQAIARKNPITKFFRGEVDYGHAPRWSKRARAKATAIERAAARLTDGRRRSSVSLRHIRQGPFAHHNIRRESLATERPVSRR